MMGMKSGIKSSGLNSIGCDSQRQHFSEHRRAEIAGGKPYRVQSRLMFHTHCLVSAISLIVTSRH